MEGAISLMEHDNCRLSKEQARSIALCIVNDIASYIKEHEEEYHKWLSQQKVVE